MNGSSNVLVLGVTGQVGKRVATNLKRKKATLSVGSRRKANHGEGRWSWDLKGRAEFQT